MFSRRFSVGSLNESHLFSQVRHTITLDLEPGVTPLNESHLFSQVRPMPILWPGGCYPRPLNESHLLSQVRPEFREKSGHFR